MKIYCLSGLGVDKKAFQNLKVDGIEFIHIEWVRPEKSESLEEYSIRLFKKNIIPEDYNLLGVSFGGMVAVEFSKIRKPKNLFLISTCSTRKGLPKLFRIAGALKLHRIAPIFLLKRVNFITKFFFGVKTIEEIKLLRLIFQETDSCFLKWALSAIFNWKNVTIPDAITIHGTNDRIIPINENVNHKILGGTHFMIVSKGDEISKIIETKK